MNLRHVSFIRDQRVQGYGVRPPYHPPQAWPELSRLPYRITLDPENKIYAMVREALLRLGLDAANADTDAWNPLHALFKPGQQALIKPNLVKHFHNSLYSGKEIENGVLSQITHAAVIRPLIDYLLLACQAQGRIIIADTPLDKGDFPQILSKSGIDALVAFFADAAKIGIETYDCRDYKRKISQYGQFLLEEKALSGPPGGYLMTDLGADSELAAFDDKPQLYYTLADFSVDRFNPRSRQRSNTNQFHSAGHHIYKIPRMMLASDLIISMPKLKTHKKTGVTLNLKNCIGICNKVYMPHYRPGAPPEGDAYPFEPTRGDIWRKQLSQQISLGRKKGRRDIQITAMKYLLRLVQRVMPGTCGNDEWWGDWHGNDTLWRTIVDLNKILHYADSQGVMHLNPQRRFFSLVDGIVGQEAEGPMSGLPKNCSLIAAGFEPLTVDAILADRMGFDCTRLRIMKGANALTQYRLGTSDLKKIEVSSNIAERQQQLNFIPSRGYRQTVKSG
jgi:uncharacterized protein (DUF362 family)